MISKKHTSKNKTNNTSNSGISKSKNNKNSKNNTNENKIGNGNGNVNTTQKDEEIIEATQRTLIIPKLTKGLKHYQAVNHNLELQLENIENYIYSDRFTHVYLYSGIDNNSVLEVRKAIDEANRTHVTSNTGNDIKLSPRGLVLHINSPGGSVTAGLGLMRIVSRSRVPIIVYIEGISASAATFISVAAKYRIMAPHAGFLIHQYMGGTFGKHEDIEFQTKVGHKLMQMMKSMYLKYTRIPAKYLDEVLQHDLWLSPELALKFGLVDRVLEPTNKSIVDKYFSINPEYKLTNAILDKKTNFNDIYLYGGFEMMDDEFQVPSNIVRQISNIIQKNQVYVSSIDTKPIHNINHVISKGGAKPIILHVSDLGQFYNIYAILPIVNILSLSPVPTISIIDGPMSHICMLFTMVCNKRFIHHYANVIVDFVYYKENEVKIGDAIYNTRHFLTVVLKLLRRYTKIPENILANIFKERFIFSANQCVQYGICDSVIN
jgi:ATP-dependent Clp endopeptidase proteolytic subunit ClpP